jgi:predicted flap endonuclease-1-like 5' DNA nuclease
MPGLEKIEGIGDAFAARLAEAGAKTVASLLEQGSTPKGRKALSEKSGLSEAQILKWVNQADLFRVRGIGEEYSNLLEAGGVDTVVELAGRNPENLFHKLHEVNAAKNLVRRLPALSQVSRWIESAKALERKVHY